MGYMMDMESIGRWRSATGKVAAVFCVVFVLSLIDTLITRFREPINVFNLLPGTSLMINGPLAERVQSVQELTYESGSNLISLSFDSLERGFYFGGNMWRGRMTVSPRIGEGEHRLVVGVKGKKMQDPPFLMKVHKDYVSYRQSSKSLILRYLNISPWVAVVSFFSLAVLSFGYIFSLSRKMEDLMAREGKAEVYSVMRREGGYEIAFSLGTRHGIKVNTCLALLNENGKPVGTVVVHKVSETDSLATLGFDCPVNPGYAVSCKGFKGTMGIECEKNKLFDL